MPSRLEQHLQMTRPFQTRAEEAMLAILCTAEALNHSIDCALEPFGITRTQYNVLRILRGAGAAGLACHAIGARLISRVPDVTRLLDRMAQMDLITRDRSQTDRRVVAVRLTERGAAMVDALDAPVQATIQRLLGHLGEDQLNRIIALMDAIRP
jgi:DNA-binding MarR family transcriptional regulator